MWSDTLGRLDLWWCCVTITASEADMWSLKVIQCLNGTLNNNGLFCSGDGSLRDIQCMNVIHLIILTYLETFIGVPYLNIHGSFSDWLWLPAWMRLLNLWLIWCLVLLLSVMMIDCVTFNGYDDIWHGEWIWSIVYLPLSKYIDCLSVIAVDCIYGCWRLIHWWNDMNIALVDDVRQVARCNAMWFKAKKMNQKINRSCILMTSYRPQTTIDICN